MKRFILVVLAAACVTACAPPSGASAAAWPATWKLPSRKLTPGATAPGYGIRDICPHVNPALEAARPTYAQEQQVYREYGILSHRKGQYEIDHRIPIELLGNPGRLPGKPASIKDLWPEPNDKPDPAMIRKYHLDPAYIENSKDILEDVLHADVCSGRVRLAAAQKAFTSDWRAAYVRYVGRPPK